MSAAPQSPSCITPQPVPVGCGALVARAHRAGGRRFPFAAGRAGVGDGVGENVAATAFSVASLPVRASRMRHRLSGMPHRVSRMRRPVSRMGHRLSRISHPVSRIRFPVSRMPYRLSRKWHRGYPMAHRGYRTPHPGGRKWAKSAILRHKRPFSQQTKPQTHNPQWPSR